MRTKALQAVLTLAALLWAAACAKDPLVGLQKAYLNIPSYITVHANFCSSAPAVVKQKVKYLFLVDKSTTNQPDFPLAPGQVPNTDPSGSFRYGPIVQFINSLPPDPNQLSSFSMINFNTNAYYPQQGGFVQGFDTDSAHFVTLVKKEWVGSGSGFLTQPVDYGYTDYVAALQLALQLIKSDAQAESNSLVSPIVTSSYRLVFVSGGLPVVSTSGGLYTQQLTTDIAPVIGNILALKSDPVLGPYISSIVLNAGYYFNATQVADDITLLQAMAAAGNGQFMEFGAGQNVLYGAIAPPVQNVRRNLSDIFLMNENATWWDDGRFQLDSDGDGIPDEIETKLGSNPNSKDSDGNGVSDLIEYRLNGKPCQDAACSPANRNPYAVCDGLHPQTDSSGNISYADTDGDGLNDCEEYLLRSDSTTFDTNGDFIPDLLAVKNGIPFLPGTDGAFIQPQGDGVWNYTKLKQDLPMRVAASKVLSFKTRVSQIRKLDTLADGDRDCFELTVNPVAVIGNGNTFKLFVIENQALISNRPLLRTGVKTVPNGSNDLYFSDTDIQ